MDNLTDIRKRHVKMMRTTRDILRNVIQPVTPVQASTLRDGPEGWTILEVICHLRDFDGFFYDRAMMMLEKEYPTLPAYDHEALAIERGYNQQDLRQAFAALSESRDRFVEFFKGLSNEQWAKSGIHPERGHFTMTDAAIQICTHDAAHIEQITRILIEGV